MRASPAREPATRASPARELVLSARGIRKRFTHRGATVEVLGGIDLRLYGGQSIAVIGPSGCGKSTLLNILCGLEYADSGTVRIGSGGLGEDRDGATANGVAAADSVAAAGSATAASVAASAAGNAMTAGGASGAAMIGYVQQSDSLLPWKSVLENCILPLRLRRKGRGWRAKQDRRNRQNWRNKQNWCNRQDQRNQTEAPAIQHPTRPDSATAHPTQPDNATAHPTQPDSPAIHRTHNAAIHRTHIERGRALLQRLNLLQVADHYPHQLSGGMRQKVSFARAIVEHPRILLLDEPFRSLDGITKLEMYEWYRELQCQHGLATILVTHDIHEAASLADVVIVCSHSPMTARAIVKAPAIDTRTQTPLAIEQYALAIRQAIDGDMGTRTPDLRHAKPSL